MSGNKFNSGLPVEEGEEINLKIEYLGEKGDGIGKIEGYVIFVPETLVGREYRVRINACRKKFAFGEVVEVLG